MPLHDTAMAGPSSYDYSLVLPVKGPAIDDYSARLQQRDLPSLVCPIDDRPISIRVSGLILPGLQVSVIQSSGFRLASTKELDAGQDIFAVLCDDATVMTKRADQAARITDASGFIGSVDRSCETTFHGGSQISIRIPPTAFETLPDILYKYNTLISANNLPLKLLKIYLSVFKRADLIDTPRMKTMVVTHIYDLFQLAVGTTDDVGRIAAARGGAAARLFKLKRDVDLHLFETRLGAAFLARLNGITPRHIHRLFEEDGTTLSSHINEQRLLRAYELLAGQDPRLRKVVDIAASIGFNDLSYFNRTFSRRFGARPTEVRALFEAARPR